MEEVNIAPKFKTVPQTVDKNYRLVFLLEFVRIFYNQHVIILFPEINLISSKEFGFRPGDFTNPFLSIAHKILSAFDDGQEVSGVFLDISKAFYTKVSFSSYKQTGYWES